MKTKEHLAAIYEADREVVSVKLDGKPIRFIDDWGLDDEPCHFYVIGEEFGPRVLVHARSYDSAYEAFLDEEPTIPESEITEAYDDESPLELIEGYAYQPNATGTGIVSVSHHLFQWELTDIDRLTFRSRQSS